MCHNTHQVREAAKMSQELTAPQPHAPLSNEAVQMESERWSGSRRWSPSPHCLQALSSTLGPAPGRGCPCSAPRRQWWWPSREPPAERTGQGLTHPSWDPLGLESGTHEFRVLLVASAEEPTHRSLSFPVQCSNTSSSEASVRNG